jgi:hypothetical protein
VLKRGESEQLVLEIIIHRRSLILRDTLLLAIHLRDLTTRGGLIGLLVITYLDEPGETKTDALFARRIYAFLPPSLVTGTEGQIGSLDFPDVSGLKPDVWLMLSSGRV